MLFMELPSSLTVDLADPASIRAKLPEAEKTLKDLEQELEEQMLQIERWRGLVEVLHSLVPAEAEPPAQLQPPQADEPGSTHLSPMQALVIEVVNREVRKIRAKTVTRTLQSEGHDVTGDAVANALWYSAEKLEPKPIQRAGHGMYAPLSFSEQEEQPAPARAYPKSSESKLTLAEGLTGAGIGLLAGAGASHVLANLGGAVKGP
jgi:hypothetical protein